MRKIICVLLMAVLFVGLTGCEEKTNELVGTWETSVDMTRELQEILSKTDFAGTYKVENFTVPCRMELRKDNTFRVVVNPVKLDQQLLEMEKDMEQGLLELLQQLLHEQSGDIDLNEILALSDQTPEALTQHIREKLETVDFSLDIAALVAVSGRYTVKDGKLYFHTGEEIDDEEEFTAYKLEGNTLTLTGNAGKNPLTAEHRILGKPPVTFTKLQ